MNIILLRTTRLLSSLAVASIFAVACDTIDNTPESDVGLIDVVATVDSIYTDTDGSMAVLPADMLPELSDFALRLTSEADSRSHLWESITDYSATEPLMAGPYTATVFARDTLSEGYVMPSFSAGRSFSVAGGTTTQVNMTSTLRSAIARATVNGEISPGIRSVRPMLHTIGHGYVTVDPAQADRLCFFSPGRTHLMLEVETDDGRKATYAPGLQIDTRGACAYNIDIELSADGHCDITLTYNGQSTPYSTVITPELLESTAPVLTPVGFTQGTTLSVTQGFTPVSPIAVSIDKPLSALRSLTFTTLSADMAHAGFPEEMNLLTFHPDNGMILPELETWAETVTVNLNAFIASILFERSTDVRFVLTATDISGLTSIPVVLNLSATRVTMQVHSISSAVVGINEATVELALNVPDVEPEDLHVAYSTDNGREETAEIIDARMLHDPDRMSLTFKVPEGTNPIDVTINYLDLSSIEIEVPRIPPHYAMQVDAFASSAVVKIESESQATTSAVTRFISFVKAGGQEAYIYNRQPDTGIITITGLTPDQAYNLRAVVVEGSVTQPLTFKTEEALQVPSGDFEDVSETVATRLLCGGRYSTTDIPIFNHQNYSNVSAWMPKKHWASVNDKTFSRAASNRNTWYIQPSATIDFQSSASGSKSALVTSVGWDLGGAAIPDYCQRQGEQLPYSDNIPEVAHRSAGRLFLGEYRFDPATLTETYVEGVKFTSRPSSLNGYYKYFPDATSRSDMGLIEVSIIGMVDGEETEIAHGRAQLPMSPDFKTFNIPLEYTLLRTPATSLRIMIASSVNAGSIADEDINIPVTADPRNAVMQGSRLWVDNLTFTY